VPIIKTRPGISGWAAGFRDLGPLTGAFARRVAGATAGGLIGTMVGGGIPEERARTYEAAYTKFPMGTFGEPSDTVAEFCDI